MTDPQEMSSPLPVLKLLCKCLLHLLHWNLLWAVPLIVFVTPESHTQPALEYGTQCPLVGFFTSSMKSVTQLRKISVPL